MPRHPANAPTQAPRRSNRIAAGRVSKPTAKKSTNTRPLRIRAFQPNSKSKFKKANDEDEDEESSPSPPPQPPAPPAPKAVKSIKCDFCAGHEVGQRMDADLPCNWPTSINMECQNCSNYRSRSNELNAPRDVVCRSGSSTRPHRNYGDGHPFVYPEPTVCQSCEASGKSAACDVDTLLGYSCSFCRAPNSCLLPTTDEVMERRPNPRQGSKKWIRHSCDSCHNLQLSRRESTTVACSWTSDRSQWGRACSRCAERKMMCIDGAIIVHMPQQLFPPNNWKPYTWNNEGWAELRPNTPWRRACVHCTRDGAHCRAACDRPYSACNRCTQMGIDCVDSRGTLYPLFDLSQVGFGSHMPFPNCARCTEMGRPCDRQRPCDSCTANQERHMCDQSVKGMKMKGNCLWTRLDPAPGPIYYLAMGYSAAGVTRKKRNHKIEHWVGPPVPYYGVDANRKNSGRLTRMSSKCREKMLPPAIPPHAIPGSTLAITPPSHLTVIQIAEMIRQHWRDAYEPRRHREFINALDIADQTIAGSLVTGNVGAQIAEDADADEEPEPNTQPEAQPLQQAPQAAGVGNMAGGAAQEDVDASGEDIEMTVPPMAPVRIIRVQAQLPVGPSRPDARAELPTDWPPVTPSELSFDGNVSPPPPAPNIIPSAHPLPQRPTEYPIQQSHDAQTNVLPQAPTYNLIQQSHDTQNYVPPPAPTGNSFQGMVTNPLAVHTTPPMPFPLGGASDQLSMASATWNGNTAMDVDTGIDLNLSTLRLDGFMNVEDETQPTRTQQQHGFATEANPLSEDVQMTTPMGAFRMVDDTGFSIDTHNPQSGVGIGNHNLSNLPPADPALFDAAAYASTQALPAPGLDYSHLDETQQAPVAPMSWADQSGGALTASIPPMITLNSGFPGNSYNSTFSRTNAVPAMTPQQMMPPAPMHQAGQQSGYTNYTNMTVQASVQPQAHSQFAGSTNTFFPLSQLEELPQVHNAGGFFPYTFSFSQNQPSQSQLQPQVQFDSNSNTTLQSVPQEQPYAQFQFQLQQQFHRDLDAMEYDSAVHPTANTQSANAQVGYAAGFFGNVPNQANAPAAAATATTTADIAPFDFTQMDALLSQDTQLDANWMMVPSQPFTNDQWQTYMQLSQSQAAFFDFSQTQGQEMRPVPDEQRSPVRKLDDDNYVKRRWRLMNKYHPNERDKITDTIDHHRRRRMEIPKYKIFGRVLEQGIERDLSQENPLRNVLGTVPELDENGAIAQTTASGMKNNNNSSRRSSNNNSYSTAGVGSSSGNNIGVPSSMMGSFPVSISHHPGQNTNNSSTTFINGSMNNFSNNNSSASNNNSQDRLVRYCGQCLADTTLKCDHAVTLDHKCISLEHGSTGEPPYACDTCAQHTRDVLVDPNFKAISSGELRRLRAYLCDECTTAYGDTRKMSRLHKAGFNNVWGLGNRNEQSYSGTGATLRYFARQLPLTGCSCGVKMLRSHVCKYHRYENAEKALHFANKAREWRLQKFGREICPACLLTKSASAANLATDMPPPINGVPQHDPTSLMRSWACFACSGWVMNQLNRPKLVPGWRTWFSWNPASLEEKDNTAITPDDDNAQ